MTIIAFDGRTLAADRMMSIGDHKLTVMKLARIDTDRIAGFVGCAMHVGAFLHWWNTGREPEKWPAMKDDQAMNATIVERADNDRGYRVWRYETGPFPIELFDAQFAAGSGRDYARAAMHLGCDARQAVEIASLFDEMCGGGVDELTLLEASEEP